MNLKGQKFHYPIYFPLHIKILCIYVNKYKFHNNIADGERNFWGYVVLPGFDVHGADAISVSRISQGKSHDLYETTRIS